MRSPRRVALALALAVLLVLAGCAGQGAPTTTDGTDGPTATTATTGGTTDGTDPGTTTAGETTGDGTTGGTTAGETTTAAAVDPPDPPTDRLGWENGYWYNESLSVTPADGYNESELRRLVARTMARLEVIRDLEFEDEVSVEVISREEYRERNVFEFEPDPWRNQVYEALFLVGEDADAAEALNSVYGGSVAGYYASGDIVLVSDDPDSVEVDRGTLAHELVHALQDDHLDLGRVDRTMDGRSAARGLTEGEANFVMDRYQERCDAEWACISQAARGGGDRSYDVGVFLTLFLPYSDGPALIGDLVERGGWDAIRAAYDRPPVSTEQVIHPEAYPDDEPVAVRPPDRSNREWRQFTSQRRTRERVGEAALYVTFRQNGVIPGEHLRSDDRRYNYSHPITEGWGGDVVVPYRNGDEFGYVFASAWDTERDARQFHQAYLDLLDRKDAERVGEDTYVVPDGPYEDAFRVVRDGKRVVVVNGPTVEDLEAIRPAE